MKLALNDYIKYMGTDGCAHFMTLKQLFEEQGVVVTDPNAPIPELTYSYLVAAKTSSGFIYTYDGGKTWQPYERLSTDYYLHTEDVQSPYHAISMRKNGVYNWMANDILTEDVLEYAGQPEDLLTRDADGVQWRSSWNGSSTVLYSRTGTGSWQQFFYGTTSNQMQTMFVTENYIWLTDLEMKVYTCRKTTGGSANQGHWMNLDHAHYTQSLSVDYKTDTIYSTNSGSTEKWSVDEWGLPQVIVEAPPTGNDVIKSFSAVEVEGIRHAICVSGDSTAFGMLNVYLYHQIGTSNAWTKTLPQSIYNNGTYIFDDSSYMILLDDGDTGQKVFWRGDTVDQAPVEVARYSEDAF